MAGQTDFDRYQEELKEKLRKGELSIKDMPFYEKGKATDAFKITQLDYLDVKDKIYGRKFGKNGIGRLKEVALTKITERESYLNHPYYKEDPDYFVNTGIGGVEHPDIKKYQEQQENFAKVLKENGVNVHWIDFPENLMGPFGPVICTWAGNDTMVTRGGSIVQKGGMYMFGAFGRFEFLARWALLQLNIPILLTITGRGICEAAPVTHFVTEDVMIAGMSTACNQEGLNQLLPAIERTSGVENFQVIVNKMPIDRYFDHETGVSAHMDIVFTAVDLGKVLLYPPCMNTETLLWFKEHKFEIIEIDREEQIKYLPTNLILLEPGKVIVHAGAKRTIEKLKKAGVEVIDIPATEQIKMGGGIHCATLEVYREPGPSLKDML